MLEHMPDYLRLTGAEGGIQQNETQETETIDRLTLDLANGRFHRETSVVMPCKCIDGRRCPEATEGPNAAGGTETIFVADDLTSKRFEADDFSVTEGMRKIIEALQAFNYPVGGHSDNTHADMNDSGCGANDKLPRIYDMIVRQRDTVKKYVEAILGEGTVDAETEHLILQNAGSRLQNNDFSTGKDVYDVLDSTPDAQLEELNGAHNEVIAVINLREGTTLDRTALENEYGSNYQAFNVDAWSFRHAAEATSDNDTEIQQKIIAMAYYNIATALTLCGPKMRVIVLN